MSADTTIPFVLDPSTVTPDATHGDVSGGGAGRGGGQNGSGSPLVVVQQGRGAAPPRPAPRPSQGNTDNSLRNGYAAISHSVSGETAAIGLGFLAAGPVGAILAGAAAPVVLAAMMWRGRQAQHDENSNGNGPADGTQDRPGTGSRRGSDGTGGTGNSGRGNGAGGAGGDRHKAPRNSNGNHGPHGNRKPKTKDPILDKLGRGLDKLKNNKGADNLKGPKNKTPKPVSRSGKDKASKAPNGSNGDKTHKASNGGGAKGLKDGLREGTKGLLKDRGKQPSSERPWRDRGDKPEKPPKTKKDRRKKSSDDDTWSSTARDGLDPKTPKGGKGGPTEPGCDPDEILDGELVDDDLPPKPGHAPSDVIDGEVIDEERITLVRAKREQAKRRAAIKSGKQAADQAARDGDRGDPRQVRLQVIRDANRLIDLQLHYESDLLALTQATEQRRSTPVNYPAIEAAPAGTRTEGAAVARQVDFRASTAYAILRAMAEQLANGLYNDDDADMADHIVELTGIPNMCKNLSVAVQEAARALARTAPLHPSVIKHLNNAAVAARTAGAMADNIMVVFVKAHREDIIRVLDPRIGEERWNLRNGPGTLDAAKLRAAIASAHSARLALPAGASSNSTGGSKLVPASDGSTKKLINLMKGFTRGHMVVVLSEVAGSAAGVEVVADSVTKLYRRMAKTWPTEGVVDDTVRATASKVRTVADELKKAIKAAQRAHQRELKLNAKPRKGARSEKKWDVVGRRGPSN